MVKSIIFLCPVHKKSAPEIHDMYVRHVAHFWARFSGRGPLVMKSSVKDADATFAPVYVLTD